jgi:RNA polymerase sigma factor (sigma-70 family)
VKTSLNRTNNDWILFLNKDHADYNRTLEELREYLFNGLGYSFKNHKKLNNENLEDLCQEAMIRIVDNIDTYSGQALFTSWAMKIAINTVLSELRHKSWLNVSLEKLAEDESFLNTAKGYPIYMSAEKKLLRKEMAQLCNALIDEVLSQKQRTAMVYRMKYAMPLDEIARRTGSSRNGVYKLLHDARMKLKKAMESRGISRDDIAEMGN